MSKTAPAVYRTVRSSWKRRVDLRLMELFGFGLATAGETLLTVSASSHPCVDGFAIVAVNAELSA